MSSTNKTKKLLVLCPHPVGYAPGQRLKYEQYFSDWEQNGFLVDVQPFMTEAFQQVLYKKGNFIKKAIGIVSGYFRRTKNLFIISKYDLVYIFLWVTPLGPPVFEWLAVKLARKIIYDIDDLVFLKNQRAEPWYALLLKGRQKPSFLMKRADHVITCTPFLDSYARQFNANTTDISSTVNTETYQPVNAYSNDTTITLGWSGSHSTIRMLKTILPVFTELKKLVNFKLLIMGSKDFQLEGIPVETVEWSEEKEIITLQRMDIGLYPLPMDEEWVKGKSGLKAIQYMAMGIPTIASNTGCNDRVIEKGISGFLVNTQEEWIEKLLLLIPNPPLRKQIGLAGRERVEKMFSITVNAPVYLSILNEVINKNKQGMKKNTFRWSKP